MKKEIKCFVTAELDGDKLQNRFPNVEFEFAGYHINHVVLDREILKKKITNVDILICEYDTIDREILECAKKLKLIICCRGGVSTVIDLQYAKELGIRVCNTPGRNADALAELCLGFILDLARNIVVTNILIHENNILIKDSSKPKEYKDVVWGLDNNSPFIRFRGKSLKHLSIGIIGFGKTGQSLAKMCNNFGMKIYAYSPHIEQKVLPSYVNVVELEKLLSISDIVSLHATVKEDNKNMMNDTTFGMMKDGSYFINTARGELVDENALVDALNSGKLAGAALDVTKKEPIEEDSVLLTAKNLILTPHIAGSATDVQHEVLTIIIDTLIKYFNNKPIDNEVIV